MQTFKGHGTANREHNHPAGSYPDLYPRLDPDHEWNQENGRITTRLIRWNYLLYYIYFCNKKTYIFSKKTKVMSLW